MAEYETEEQQVEALKDWWKQNGMAVVGGAVLGISALVGWRGWNWYQEKQATEASDIFAVVQEAANKNDTTALQKQTNILRDNYASTPYAPLAILHQAKNQIEQGENAAAEESLRWVLKNSKQDTVQNVARLRLARLLLADNKVDEAQAMVNSGMTDAYASLTNEIRGDIFVAKGEIEQAKEAYDQAMQAASGAGVEYLQLKRNDLGS
ncbi:MAG: tetratricopeptide repeat protein [Gammaproteobacteria bacterium]|nr:tetratricopeptide repeat protein [Gammaproteobacteria bacterium]NNC67973.1 tetratricopeptide repeat protein [Gammaproteobacteria bacterium]